MQPPPSAPATTYMDVESAPVCQKPADKVLTTPAADNKKPASKSNIRICLSITVAALISLAVLIIVISLILRFTVFKPKRPITTINSVSLQDVHFSLDILKLNVHLNATLGVAISIKNPNRVGFKYDDSSALLNYRDKPIGIAPVPAGTISAGETMPLNLILTVMADRLLSTSQIYGDVLAGQVPLTTFAKVPGKVSVFGFIKVHVVSSSSCAFTVFLSNRTVGDVRCNYKNHF